MPLSTAPVSRPGVILALFAHNDDEFFVAPLLRREIAAGKRVVVAYLTYGSAYGADANLRVAESRRVLDQIGVRPEDVMLTGLDAGIFDASLIKHAEAALRALKTTLRDIAVDQLLLPAWEGGHEDHDTCHLVGAALARWRPPVAGVFEYPTYNGYGLAWHLGRVMEFPGGDAGQRTRITLKEGWWAIRCAWSYRSQRRTFMWVLPGAVNKYLLARRQLLRPVPADRDYRLPPHAGRLFYERREKSTFAQFYAELYPFITAHLGEVLPLPLDKQGPLQSAGQVTQ